MGAESGGQEKTEQPTSKRRKDARKEGNVFLSKDISTVIILLGLFVMMRMLMPYIYKNLRAYMEWLIDAIGGDMSSALSSQLMTVTLVSFIKCAIPLLFAAVFLGIVAYGAQTRFNVSFKAVKPKLSKLNPIKGMKKLFALKNVMELIKNLIKITLLLTLLYNLVMGDVVDIARTIDMHPLASATYMLQMTFDLVLKVCMAFGVVAFFDYLYQRWEYERDLKMTKQEVKEEYKQMEGSPEIKGRIRRLQRQMALGRMMQKVPEADVIIRNPTHFAVALKYDPEKGGAPMVLAKGQDEMALRIIKVGEEHGIYIIENRPLARALYTSCELDREIPAEFYGAVAEILVYIYRASHREDMFR